MKALIRLKNGDYYASKVFAIKNDKSENDIKYGWSYQYLVLDKKNENLIYQYEYDQDAKYIIRMILVFDTDESDMKFNDKYIGKVNFITNNDLKLINEGRIPKRILSEAKKYTIEYKGEYISIETQRDIDNLISISGNFHDAYIDEIKRNDNNELVVFFDGCWGCSIEMIFSSDVEYKNERAKEDIDPYWFGCSIFFKDNKTIFVDGDYTAGEKLDDFLVFFKANKIKYKIIPYKYE